MIKIGIFICSLLIAHAAGANPGGIVIDPGHSPKSPGATSCSGKSEYLYNAALAELIVAHLSTRHISAVLTPPADQELPLADRAKLAKGKNIFLSIHHDSVQPQFITWKKQRACSDKAEGYSIFISSKNRHYGQSLKFAQRLGAALRSRGLKPSQHHGEKITGENKKLIDPENGIYLFDDLIVLKKADAPAVLLEASVIVNPLDEVKSNSQAYKLLIADAIANMLKISPKAEK